MPDNVVESLKYYFLNECKERGEGRRPEQSSPLPPPRGFYALGLLQNVHGGIGHAIVIQNGYGSADLARFSARNTTSKQVLQLGGGARRTRRPSGRLSRRAQWV
jgi:hypothetical protein